MSDQITVPTELKVKIEREAKARGMSIVEFLRQSLEWAHVRIPLDDPLLSDRATYRGEAPADLAANHDKYHY